MPAFIDLLAIYCCFFSSISNLIPVLNLCGALSAAEKTAVRTSASEDGAAAVDGSGAAAGGSVAVAGTTAAVASEDSDDVQHLVLRFLAMLQQRYITS